MKTTTVEITTCILFTILFSPPLIILCLHISRLMINNSMDEGTQLPYIRQAVSSGYGVVVLNTNDNKPNVAVSTLAYFSYFQ